MAYTLKEVNEAEARIRAEVPDAILSRTDFGFSLSVANGALTRAWIVYQAARRPGEREIKSSPKAVSTIIDLLKGQSDA